MRLTGLPVDRFGALLAGAMPLIAAAERQRLSRRERRRGTGAGRTHDKIYAQARGITPKGINRGGDTGYPGTLMKTPHKKPKGGTLTVLKKPDTASMPAIASSLNTAPAACNDSGSPPSAGALHAAPAPSS
jgi:hypothetical protein